MPGAHQVAWFYPVGNCCLNGGDAIRGRNAGRDTVAGLDRYRECSAETAFIARHHGRKIEFLHGIRSQAKTNDAAALADQ